MLYRSRGRQLTMTQGAVALLRVFGPNLWLAYLFTFHLMRAQQWTVIAFLKPDLHGFVFCFGQNQNQNKTFFVLQWYFDLSKQKVFVLVFVLTKPKQNRASQLETVFHQPVIPSPVLHCGSCSDHSVL